MCQGKERLALVIFNKGKEAPMATGNQGTVRTLLGEKLKRNEPLGMARTGELADAPPSL